MPAPADGLCQDKLVIRKVPPLLLALALACAGCSNRDTQASSSDCVRGEPEALLSSRSDFRQSSPREARETVRTGSRIKLTIRHFGCAHYALDFEFTWSDPRMPELRVSLEEAARLLEKLPFKQAYRPVMKNLIAAARRMAQQPRRPPLALSETETLTVDTPAPNMLLLRYDVAL